MKIQTSLHEVTEATERQTCKFTIMRDQFPISNERPHPLYIIGIQKKSLDGYDQMSNGTSSLESWTLSAEAGLRVEWQATVSKAFAQTTWSSTNAIVGLQVCPTLSSAVGKCRIGYTVSQRWLPASIANKQQQIAKSCWEGCPRRVSRPQDQHHGWRSSEFHAASS